MPGPSTVTNFVFTLNNPPDQDDFDHLWNPDKMKYLVFQLERGEQSRTLHLQGYCELKKRQRFAAAKSLIGDRAHLEPRRGTAAQARDYAMKEDTRALGPWEFGEFSNSFPGKRNDLVALFELAKAGKTKRELLDEFPACYLRNHKAIAHAISFQRPPKKDRKVYLLIGDPGKGKSHWVHTTYPDCWATPVESKGFWFDGYDGHDVALIDDYSGEWPLKALLRILHDWPELVPTKGSHVWWNPSKIFITTNEQYTTWYRRDDAVQRDLMLKAIKRRITKITYFPLAEGDTVE